jgi:hypothetical protein
MINLIPAIILPALLGFSFTGLLLNSDDRSGLLEKLAFAYPLGIGLVVLQMFFLGLARMPMQLGQTIPLVLLETALLGFWLVRRGANLWHIPRLDPRNSRSALVRSAEYGLTVWIALKLASIFLETSQRPIYAYDSFTNWSVRAKMFFYSDSLLLNPSSYDFFGRGINHSAGNYPPYNPLVQMWMAQWLGHFDEVLVKFWTPFFLLAAVLLLYKIAAEETNHLVSLVMVTIFISSPLISLHATETMSDLPLSVYIMFGLYSLLNVIRGRTSCIPLVGMFSALAMFIKVEGLFIAVPLCCSCCFVLWSGTSEDGRSFRRLLPRLFVPFLLILPYVLFKLINNPRISPDQLYFSLTFQPYVLWDYLVLILGLQNFNVVFIMIPIFFILTGRKIDKELLCLSLPVLAYAAFFILLYMIVSYYSDSGRFWENVFRNTFTYYPAACLILVMLVSRFMRQSDGCRLTPGMEH